MTRHSRERWAAETVKRRGPSPAALVLVMVVGLVRLVMVVNVARVGGDVLSQLLATTVELSLQLSLSLKVRLLTFLESRRSLTLFLCTQWYSWCLLQAGGTPSGWGSLEWSYCMLRATSSPSPHNKSRYAPLNSHQSAPTGGRMSDLKQCVVLFTQVCYSDHREPAGGGEVGRYVPRSYSLLQNST